MPTPQPKPSAPRSRARHVGTMIGTDWWRDDRVLALTGSAQAALVRLLSFSSDRLTDGVVPRGAADMIVASDGGQAALDELESAGELTIADGKILINRWAEHNLSAGEVAERREQAAQAGRKGGRGRVTNQPRRSSRGTFLSDARPDEAPHDRPDDRLDSDQTTDHTTDQTEHQTTNQDRTPSSVLRIPDGLSKPLDQPPRARSRVDAADGPIEPGKNGTNPSRTAADAIPTDPSDPTGSKAFKKANPLPAPGSRRELTSVAEVVRS